MKGVEMHLEQVAQRAEDLDRAIGFYETFLESPVAARFDPPGLAFFLVGRTRLLLDAVAPSALVYFEVDDVDAKTEELRARGVRIVTEPHVIFRHEDDSLGHNGTEERMAFFLDSEGNTVGLVGHTAVVTSGAVAQSD